MSLEVNEQRCIGCGWCVLLCPEEALQVCSNFIVKVEEDKCTECLRCIDTCPNDCLEEK